MVPMHLLFQNYLDERRKAERKPSVTISPGSSHAIRRLLPPLNFHIFLLYDVRPPLSSLKSSFLDSSTFSLLNPRRSLWPCRRLRRGRRVSACLSPPLLCLFALLSKTLSS
jgi:hypothetical protein